MDFKGICFAVLCREQGAMPPEKKKKGKRKSDAVLEMVESDDTTSLSTLATGEESIDPIDNTVSSSETIYIWHMNLPWAE